MGITLLVFGENTSKAYRRLCLFCIPSLLPEGREEQEVCSIALNFQLNLNLTMGKGALIIQSVICVCIENQEWDVH